jgi:chemotaxis protein MotB
VCPVITAPHIETRLTDEGLVIEIFSRPGHNFDADTGPNHGCQSLRFHGGSLWDRDQRRRGWKRISRLEPMVRAAANGWLRTTERAGDSFSC